MGEDYGYANARIRAMKSRLLDARAYDDLLAAASLDQIIELLSDTAYKAEIEAALVKYGGIQCVSEALRTSLSHTIGRIKSFFSARSRELVGILLARWDIFNVVAILRGQARGVSAAEILDTLVPVGELTEFELREMAQQPAVRATADLMLAWHLPYARILAEALRGHRYGDLSDVETHLQQLRYREALAGLGDEENDLLVREMLQAEIDVANLGTLLRLCRLGDRAAKLQARYGAADATGLLIKGGGLPWRVLKELSVAREMESIVSGLGEGPYARLLGSRMEAYRQSGEIAVLERGLEEFLVLKGVGMFHRDPLSIAIPIGYIWAKSNEVTNLRLIAHGKAFGLGRDEIRQEFIWWVRE